LRCPIKTEGIRGLSTRSRLGRARDGLLEGMRFAALVSTPSERRSLRNCIGHPSLSTARAYHLQSAACLHVCCDPGSRKGTRAAPSRNPPGSSSDGTPQPAGGARAGEGATWSHVHVEPAFGLRPPAFTTCSAWRLTRGSGSWRSSAGGKEAHLVRRTVHLKGTKQCFYKSRRVAQERRSPSASSSSVSPGGGPMAWSSDSACPPCGAIGRGRYTARRGTSSRKPGWCQPPS